MLNLCAKVFFIMFTFCVVNYAPALDTETMNILSLLKEKDYLTAVNLMEKSIHQIKDSEKKGYYALLLNQIPLDLPMKGARHEYAFMAARWAVDIPEKKRTALWIEAGDGFFRAGDLQKARQCYEKLLSYLPKDREEFVYVSHKQAWVYVNEKKWTAGVDMLASALARQKNRLRDIVLFDMGKIWVESQYFKNRATLEILVKSLKETSPQEQDIIMDGMVQGVKRTAVQGTGPLVRAFSSKKDLSTRVLNHFLSSATALSAIAPCKLLPWLENTNIREGAPALSILNSCARKWMAVKKKSALKTRELKKLADLYVLFTRTGVDRWPLALVYWELGRVRSACEESLRQLTEVVTGAGASSEEEMEKSVPEALRLCKNARPQPALVKAVVRTALSSSVPVQKYQNKEGVWELALFNLLNLKLFYPALREYILKANVKWAKKALLPQLIVARMGRYSSRQLSDFLIHFASKQWNDAYLDILLNREDVLTVDLLQKILPLSKVDSYDRLLPWLRPALSEEMSLSGKEHIIQKLLKYFPTEEEKKRSARLFMVLHYLKTGRIFGIFKNWDRLNQVFREKKNLTVELFEKALYRPQASCSTLKVFLSAKEINSSPLLRFIHGCCGLVTGPVVGGAVRTAGLGQRSDKTSEVVKLKLPSFLRSNALAWDFLLLVRAQKKTSWLKQNITLLNQNTVKMVKDLKKSVSRYQARKWRSKEVAKRVGRLLKTQVDLFEKELSRLAGEGPYKEKYIELKKIVAGWR